METNSSSFVSSRMVDYCHASIRVDGLVDAHTHPVWTGERLHKFPMKLAGATYMEIHQTGGGINFVVERKRRALEEELFSSFQQCMMRVGTTLVGCKSGYGLDLETELKMLRVTQCIRRELDIGISGTYCGAHSVPKLPPQGGPGFNSVIGE